jgi:hypothetical protein
MKINPRIQRCLLAVRMTLVSSQAIGFPRPGLPRMNVFEEWLAKDGSIFGNSDAGSEPRWYAGARVPVVESDLCSGTNRLTPMTKRSISFTIDRDVCEERISMKNLISRAIQCCLSIGCFFLVASPATAQNCGWSRIDHEFGYSESGLWKPDVYRDLMNTLTLAQVAGALWEGSDSRIGLTMWKGIDSQLMGAAGAEAGKRIFRRERPVTENNPCVWFHDSNHSFPSAEATNAAALVTPYVLEYGEDQPAVYGLLALPAYVGLARMRNHAHWQSDILAGWGVGAASGYYAYSRESPILVSILPRGITVGLRREF